MYDIIGDIHGCAETLQQHLQSLDYIYDRDHYRHPSHQALFLGDFIDRGPYQREVLEIVRPMVEHGSARAVMGNHEFNAIGWATPALSGDGYLRSHTPAHQHQHQAFLDAYADDRAGYDDAIAWFRTLPMWLDLGDLRLVHATWCEDSMQTLSAWSDAPQHINDAVLHEGSTYGTPVFKAIEKLLKGHEVELPDGLAFSDKDGNRRTAMRTRWWMQEPGTYREAYMGPPEYASHIPDVPLKDAELPGYHTSSPALFTGHYWLTGEPEPLAANHACVDYSVAKPGGKLASYRWQGERVLERGRFFVTDRVEG